ncbi:aromatic ring-hydroxylating oxygenase subunit alpha [Micromonospora sp. H33]|uniref:aromatic ring-hydroxylating oxygenase subunit alpha n=1 Tax=Micromonospora sp. H33 TaxID=3452215 RepID=UPI003F8C6B90
MSVRFDGPAAPLEVDDLLAASLPFGSSRTLPARAYTSPEVLAWERRHLFGGGWVCVGRRSELGGAANQRAVTVGDTGLLLTFDGATVRALANVCRHRGHELLAAGETANRAAIVCPYHGWAYRLDGTLAAAAAMSGVAAFDPADHGLIELPVAQWQGWVFVNAAGGALPFAEYLGALDELIAPYQPERLRLGDRHEYDVAANWKVIVENYHECYHCPRIHPELCRVSPPTSGDNWDLPGAWIGGSMDLREHAETMSLDGRSRGRFIEGAPRRTVRYVGLFPNLLISAHPDYVMTHRIEPLAPDRTRVECSWYVPQDATEVAYAVTFWDITNRQDWAACESVQRGLSSPHYRPGPLAPNEDAVHQWMSFVARAYLDPVAAFTAARSPGTQRDRSAGDPPGPAGRAAGLRPVGG